MTREEAISVLERVAHTEAKWPGTEDTLEALDMAISALRAQQEQERPGGNPDEKGGKSLGTKGSPLWENSPLTLDELREMVGEPVYLVDLVHKSNPEVPDLWGGWIVFMSHNENGFVPRGGGFFSNDGYGKTWLAYLRKPEEGTA